MLASIDCEENTTLFFKIGPYITIIVELLIWKFEHVCVFYCCGKNKYPWFENVQFLNSSEQGIVFFIVDKGILSHSIQNYSHCHDCTILRLWI